MRLTDDETREMLVGRAGLFRPGGAISFSDFSAWWSDLVAASPITLIHTRAEYDTLMDEERLSGRLCVVEVAFTFCTPCKGFKPKYLALAKKYKDVRFALLMGNENSEMVTLGRDVLGVKASPAFYLFKKGEVVRAAPLPPPKRPNPRCCSSSSPRGSGGGA